MDIKVYQINDERDTHDLLFMGYNYANMMGIDPYSYDCVYSGQIEAETLDSVYQLLNTQQYPDGYAGRSLSVSDVCEVIKNGQSEFYFVDTAGFKKINFDANQTKALKEETITVLACEPGKTAKIIEIPNTLEAKQRFVGGYIEAVYPFDDPVAIICNEEGKINGLPLNRALYTEEGEIFDIVAGPMLIVGLSEDDFASVPNDLLQKYKEKFEKPEVFMKIAGNIMAIKVDETKQRQEQRHTHKNKMY